MAHNETSPPGHRDRSWLGSSLTRWFVLGNFLAVAGLIGVAALLLWQMRTDAERRSEANANSLVQVLGRDIARNVELYDLSLQAVIEGFGRTDVAQASPELRQMILFDRAASAPGFAFLLLVDSHGAIVSGSNASVPMGLDRSETEYFRHFIAHPDDADLHISPPAVSQVSGQRMIMLSRRLSNSDGSFAGVVVGGIKIDYLRSLFASVDAERAGTVTLYGPEGLVLMREPYNQSAIGTSVADTPSYRRMTAMRDGSFTGPAMLGEDERRFTFARLGLEPLTLSIAVAPSVIYAEWWHRALGLGMVLLGLCGVTAGLTWLLRRELGRREQAEAELLAANARLATQATTDALTGLGNRWHFDEVLRQEWDRAARCRRPLSLILVDADCFKGFNDTYGHPRGDEALRLIAGSIRAAANRASDMVCRIGGEEFAVILPEIDMAGSELVAERIRAAVMGWAMPHTAGPHAVLTVSCGVASVPEVSAHKAAALVAEADAALYAAKNAGRNRVRAAEPSKAALRLVS
ncbi:sensor domain-containing diguanylate cyclase [Methylobacterium sp. J-070]|uniref:GGDEF domain-containing protein n=1 Tax=Methylobacterium sp. J-070 TaxID=2836650 RepID=UPI001FB9E6A4|nr:sensor domain-containing diguanylate cyclase [Methylobacterium sp. J-070]MCJ2049820.1 sensor domain-containing diguanylate cyclase [Methylobacterium sp. J-070]